MKFTAFEKTLEKTQPIIILSDTQSEPMFVGIYGDMNEYLDKFTLRYIRSCFVVSLELLRFTEELVIRISSHFEN